MKTFKRDRNRKKTSTVSLAKNEIALESEKKYLEDDNNFIDYFMEIGVKPDIFKYNFLYEAKSPNEINENLTPQIICKFPISDKRNIVVENVMVNQVFPKGFKIKVSETKPKPEFYCVVLDNQLYSAIYTRKYLACLIIYENIESYQKLNENLKLEENKFMIILRSTMRNRRPREMTIDDPIISNAIKNWYIPKCLCLVSVHPYINKYQEILNTIYKLIISNNNSSLFLDHIIERLIVQTPKIPRGHKRIILKFPGKNIEISETKMNEMPLVNVNFCRMFDILSINNVIEVFKYLLYETKLIFFSENLSDLTNTIISFLFLLEPFKYQFQIVSVLSKDLYNYTETISPFIFGINEKYTDNFFSKNKILIEDSTICVVDIDNNNHHIIAPGGQMDYKDYPEMPKKLKKKLEDKLKKNMGNINNDNSNENNSSNENNKNNSENDLKIRNERYQAIFFKIMIHILKDYPKFLSKDYSVNRDISMSIKDMIDLKSYLNMFNNSEKYFYSKIFSTQMFMEFIYKRMMPKNCNEKVEVLFFEEKIKEKTTSKMIFGKSKILEQNVLLTCTDYDYDKDIEIIDLTPNIELTNKLNNYLFDRKNYILKYCLDKGFSVAIDEAKRKSTFHYYLFPSLLSDKLFILNSELYKTPPHFYEEIEKINMKIVNKSYLKFIQNMQILKNSESENDLYLCYLIIWAITMWYTEDKEKDYRFYEMLEMLKKIEEHDIKIFEIIFKNLVEFSKDKNIILLYKIFINLRLNPSWEMFSLVSKIIKKKQNASNKKNLLHQDIDPKKLINEYKNEKKIDSFHQRSLKIDESEDAIFSNSIIFYAYFKCDKCNFSINLCELCNLSEDTLTIKLNKNKNGHEKLFCKRKLKNGKICDGVFEPKLKFRYGEELFNQKDINNLMNKRKTSVIKEIKLLFPSELKQQLMQIASNLHKKEKFNLESFRFNFPNVFWSLLFYFDLNNIDKTFLLPYLNFDANKVFDNSLNENIKYINSKKNENEIEKDKYFHIELKITDKFQFKDFFIQENEIKKYDIENLCIQNVYNLCLINNIFYSFKKSLGYEENISYNELPLIIFEKNVYSPISKRNSKLTFNENDTFNTLFVRDSILPFHKRNSDTNIVFQINEGIKKGELPLDNHLLIRNTNPLEENIFDFESSDNDFDDTPTLDQIFAQTKSKTLNIEK